MDDGFKNVAKVNSPPSEGEAATRGRKRGVLKISVAQNYSWQRRREFS